MTACNSSRELCKRKKQQKSIVITLLVLITSIAISVIFSPRIGELVKNGLLLCFSSVIGAIFPFLILTDLITAITHFENIDLLRRLFEKLFKINGYAISAFICGIICGFPIGVKVAADLYKSGCISKNECERLIAFSNNTGPAFVISGIGFALRKSIIDGIILYISMVLSAVIIGIILGIGKRQSFVVLESTNKKYDFSSSVKTAATNTLNICGFVVLFSVVCGTLELFVKNEVMRYVLVSLLEVSNAAKILAHSDVFAPSVTLIFTAFAISFSGVSVHMQAKSFLTETNISMKTYYLAKFTQGIIASTITALLVFIL